METPTATTLESLDQTIQLLSKRKQDWLKVPLKTRVQYLQTFLKTMPTLAANWVEQACLAKGLDPKLAGEEWLSGPTFICRYLRLLIRSLQANGQPQPLELFQRDHQWIAQVVPQDWMESLLFFGFSGEVWIEPGYQPSQGQIYRERPTLGQICGVLGAGNIACIPVLDCLQQLFVANKVVILKMNPVNAYLGPFIEKLLHLLIRDGFLAVVYGGAEVGQYLCQNNQIGSIHITGSAATHHRIVWGDPATSIEHNSKMTPLLNKEITSELGCVTPVFVVPGTWSESDIKYQARHIASMVGHNGSFNCNAPKVLITAQGWPQRELFLEALRQEFTQMPPRRAYYPGAWQRFQSFLDHYPQAEVLGSSEADQSVVPWTLIPHISPSSNEYALNTEAFCGVLAEVPLTVADPVQFIKMAVEVATTQIWGTLSCMFIIDPVAEKVCRTALDQALKDLEYGAISINGWSATIFSFMSTSWGSFPGQTLANIQSGRGSTHNTYLFDHPQKSIVRAPFRLPVTPPWFYNHRQLTSLGKHFMEFEVEPTGFHFLKVLYSLVLG